MGVPQGIGDVANGAVRADVVGLDVVDLAAGQAAVGPCGDCCGAGDSVIGGQDGWVVPLGFGDGGIRLVVGWLGPDPRPLVRLDSRRAAQDGFEGAVVVGQAQVAPRSTLMSCPVRTCPDR